MAFKKPSAATSSSGTIAAYAQIMWYQIPSKISRKVLQTQEKKTKLAQNFQTQGPCCATICAGQTEHYNMIENDFIWSQAKFNLITSTQCAKHWKSCAVLGTIYCSTFFHFLRFEETIKKAKSSPKL